MTDRWPRSIYGQGTEPDARFSLANERTFLAGIRTSLALLAAGVALEALDVPVQEDLRLVVSVILLVLAGLYPVEAWRTWSRAELAMRLNAPMPSAGPLAFALAGGVSLACVLLVVGLFLR